MPAPKNKIFNVTDLENLIEIFGIAIEAIEFHSDEEATISIHGYRHSIKDIYQNYSSLKQSVMALIQEAEQKIKLVEKQLQKNRLVRRLGVTSVMIMLGLSSLIGYLIFRQEQLWIQTQRLVAELEEVNNPSNIKDLKIFHEKLTQAIARLEQVPNTLVSPYEHAQNDLVNLRSRKDIVEQRLKTEQQAIISLEASQKAAMEAIMLVQKPTHTIAVGQQAQAKWQEAINLLKTIPDSTFVSAQAKEKLVTYQSNYDSLTIKTSSEKQASTSLDIAKKLSWEAAKAIQQPPHPVAVWKEARHKLQKAIELLEGISKNTPVFTEAQQKLLTYRSNYVVISKRLIIEENAEKNLTLAENLAKQAVATIQTTPYTVIVLQNAQSRLGQATHLLKSIPSGTSVSSNAASLIQVYNRNSTKINNRIKEVKTCISLQQSYCLEANMSLELDSY